jgi:peptidoglycan/LPS O-acetylase OafA/YrhL
MGVAIHYVPSKKKMSRWLYLMMILVCLCLMGGYSLFEKMLPKGPVDIPFGILVAIFLWLLISMPTLVGSKLLAGISGHFSRISYTLYLFHLPALVFIVSFLDHERRPFSLTFVLIAAVPLAIVLGYAELMYLCFEVHTDVIRVRLAALRLPRSLEPV